MAAGDGDVEKRCALVDMKFERFRKIEHQSAPALMCQRGREAPPETTASAQETGAEKLSRLKP